jgi:hypothetical protein
LRGFGLSVLAVQAIRRMRGGAQSQLMLGADGKLWVVKFQNNPQDVRVLANELIATRLAAAVGLTVPASDVVEVTDWLVANTLDMFVELPRGQRQRYVSGLQFGSQFVGGLMPGQVVDYLPEQQLDEVRNLAEFAGMLCIDKWAGTAMDGRRCSSGSQGSGSIGLRLSIRVFASTRESGRFRIRRCEVFFKGT